MYLLLGSSKEEEETVQINFQFSFFHRWLSRIPMEGTHMTQEERQRNIYIKKLNIAPLTVKQKQETHTMAEE